LLKKCLYNFDYEVAIQNRQIAIFSYLTYFLLKIKTPKENLIVVSNTTILKTILLFFIKLKLKVAK